jgi:hypothetical protein
MVAAGSTLAASIDVQPTAATTALALDGAAPASVRIVKIAEVTIIADGARGCSVWITGGNLARAGGSPIPFEVAAVPRGAPAPSATAFAIGSYRFTTSATTAVADVYIKYRPAALQRPGNYTASVAIDATDN